MYKHHQNSTIDYCERFYSQLLDEMISNDEWSIITDKVYSSDERKQALRKKVVYYEILYKGRRNCVLCSNQMQRNCRKSVVRTSVERPFANLSRVLKNSVFEHSFGTNITIERMINNPL